MSFQTIHFYLTEQSPRLMN